MPPYRGYGRRRHEGGRELGAHVLEALLPDLESEGKRRGNAAALLAAFCDVGLCGGELTMSYAEALRDDGTADALEACAVVATGSRDVWRRSDLRGRLSKLALKDASGDDARLLQAKNALRNPAPRSPATSRGRIARRSRGLPNGRARDAPLAPSWSDLRNAEATGRWWRRGGPRPARADALADDVSRRAAAKAPSSSRSRPARAAPEHAGEARGVRGVGERPTPMTRRRRCTRSPKSGSATTARRRASSRPAAAASRPTTRSTPRSRSCGGASRRTSPSASSSRAGTPSRLPMLLKMRARQRGGRRTWESSAPRCSDPSCPCPGFFKVEGPEPGGRRGRPGSPCSLLCGVCSWRLQMRRRAPLAVAVP